MRTFFAIALLAACGGQQTPAPQGHGAGGADPVGVVEDTRPEIVKRRDTACEALKPKLVQCTVDDAQAALDAGRIAKKEFDAITAPPILEKHGTNWMDKCSVDMSSRQVRVLEVCLKEEQECGPLISCLEHLQPQK